MGRQHTAVKSEAVTEIDSLPGLVEELRLRLQVDTNFRRLRKTGAAIDISHVWLIRFRDGRAVCMDVMNRLANHYGINYQIRNFDPKSLENIPWVFPEK